MLTWFGRSINSVQINDGNQVNVTSCFGNNNKLRCRGGRIPLMLVHPDFWNDLQNSSVFPEFASYCVEIQLLRRYYVKGIAEYQQTFRWLNQNYKGVVMYSSCPCVIPYFFRCLGGKTLILWMVVYIYKDMKSGKLSWLWISLVKQENLIG